MIPQFSILPATTWFQIIRLSLVCCVAGLGSASSPAWCQATITVDIVDEKSGQPIPCRVELRDAKGRTQKTRGGLNIPPWSIVDGKFVFRGRAGDYEFDVSQGPEYAQGGGGFTLDRDGEGTDVVRLPRYADMASEGWYAGDLLACVPAKETGQWLSAEGLHMAAVIASPATPAAPNAPAKAATGTAPKAVGVPGNTSIITPRVDQLPETRWCNVGSYYDDRPGSGLLLHNWQPPAAVPAGVPSSRLLTMAKQSGDTHAEIVRLWARDAPVWLASGRIDSIQILSEHVTRDGRTPIKLSDMFHPEPGLFKGPRGTGRLVENLYWQVLECGLQIPPSAGSAAGRSSSPLGYNRVYVAQSSAQRSDATWWEGLRAGRSIVTNGPLLRATVNGQLPGHTFQIGSGAKLMLDIALQLTVADPVEYVDVVFNGDAIYHARLDEYAKQGGKIPALEIIESGWIVIRVVTQREDTYRLASTAPYYVQLDGQTRISRRACEMFSNWLESSSSEQQRTDPTAAKAAAPYTSAAQKFWRDRINTATTP